MAVSVAGARPRSSRRAGGYESAHDGAGAGAPRLGDADGGVNEPPAPDGTGAVPRSPAHGELTVRRWPVRGWLAVRGRPVRVRAGQIVATQVALALALAATGHGPTVVAMAMLAGLALVLGAWVRLRRRWLFEWLLAALRHLCRQRRVPAPADPAALLQLVAPGAEVRPTSLGGVGAAAVYDGWGLSAVLELGDPATLLSGPACALPSPAELLPADGTRLPPTRVQLLLTAAPAPAGRVRDGIAAGSYRQLVGGRVLGHERALVVIRVLRTEGWCDDDLRRALSSVVRTVRRRLVPVPARPLDADAVLRVVAETAHHDSGPAIRESWAAVHLGGQLQTTFQLGDWPDPPGPNARRLVPRLLAVPATATTVALGAGPRCGDGTGTAADLTVRLAAGDPSALAASADELCRLVAGTGARARRLDGEQLRGLSATLPLGVPAPGPAAMTPGALPCLDLPYGAAGLVVGTDRHGEPLAVRLFRPGPTRAVLVGGLSAAQLITMRAIALGARVVVRTDRAAAWEPFARGAGTPVETVSVVTPGHQVGGPAGGPLHPLLVVVDAGPVTAPQRLQGWQAELVVRDELLPADLDTVAGADVALLQPLRAGEAALAGSALGLGESARWLTEVRADMVAVLSGRTLRWALLSATAVESRLVGSPVRG